MKNKILFSITTPCYNSEATIERTIKSILAQNYDNYEYIIVDGGSTDSTLDIVKKYEPMFCGKMRWKSEPDKGLYDAFNKGIEQSNGLYCWNVNSDDYIEPDALRKLSLIIDNFDIKCLPVISGISRIVTKEGKVVKLEKHSKQNAAFCYKTNGMGVTHPATLVPKTVYDKFGTYDIRFKISADIDWFNRIYRNHVDIFFLDEILTNMQDDGVSNRFDYTKNAKDRILLLKKKYSNRFTRVYFFCRWTVNYLRTNLKK